MNVKRVLATVARATIVAAAVGLAIGGAEAAGLFKEATGFDAAGSSVTPAAGSHAPDPSSG